MTENNITNTIATNTDINITTIHTIVVHDGPFHLDDVMAVALIQLARLMARLPLCKVIRTSKVQEDWTLKNGYVVADIGGGRFDHHFPEEQQRKRNNGTPYAAAGLILEAVWLRLGLSYEEFQQLDADIVEPSDLHDNRFTGNPLSLAIKSLNPNWNEAQDPETMLACFNKAVSIVQSVIKCQKDTIRYGIENPMMNVILALTDAQTRRVKSEKAMAGLVNEAIQSIEGGVIWLDKFSPIGSDPRVKQSAALFIGAPSARGGYQVCAIRLDKKGGGSESKMLFPKEYWGSPDTSCGMTFCHPAGFMACFVDKESAKQFMSQLLAAVTAA